MKSERGIKESRLVVRAENMGNFEQNKKMFWKEVKRERKGKTGNEETVKDVKGNFFKGDAARVRWTEYFKSLLNTVDEREASICAVVGAVACDGE